MLKHVPRHIHQSGAPAAPVEFDRGLEYEVDYLLDVRVTHMERGSRSEYLVKWVGYPIWDITWEPEQNLAYCQ